MCITRAYHHFAFRRRIANTAKHIQASNKIKNTVSGSQFPPKCHYSHQQAPARSGQRKPFLWKQPLAANSNTGEDTNIGPTSQWVRTSTTNVLNELQVSTYNTVLPSFLVYLENEVKTFTA